MDKQTCFADTYALISTINGDEHYQPFLKKKFLCCEGNLMEMTYYLLREQRKEEAITALTAYQTCLTPITNHTILKAMAFKFHHQKENLSYVDCIGYQRAKELGIPFLTGDSKFKDKENVFFIPAQNP